MEFALYGHIMRRDESQTTRRMFTMKIDRCRSERKPRDMCMDCMRNDRCIKSENTSIIADKMDEENFLCQPYRGRKQGRKILIHQLSFNKGV